MLQFLSNEDLKTLAQGIAGVAACGLILGSAMHPQLDIGDRPGPQILLGSAGQRSGGDAPDPGVGVYAGRTPDYVIGTDWTRPAPVLVSQATPDPAPEQSEAVVFSSDDELTTPMVHRAEWRDEPREAPLYPSAQGGVAYEANRPAPPPPPDDADLG